MGNDDRSYTQEEVDAILHRALSRGGELRDRLSHGDLVATAKEIGIAPEALERAIAEEGEERALAREREEWRASRRAWLRRAAGFYLFVNALCLMINLLAGGPLWFYWVAGPWGLVLLAAALGVTEGPSEAKLRRMRDRRERRRLRDERRARRSIKAEQVRRGATVFEDVVEEGVGLLLDRLGERMRRLDGDRRGPDRRLPGDDRDPHRRR